MPADWIPSVQTLVVGRSCLERSWVRTMCIDQWFDVVVGSGLRTVVVGIDHVGQRHMGVSNKTTVFYQLV